MGEKFALEARRRDQFEWDNWKSQFLWIICRFVKVESFSTVSRRNLWGLKFFLADLERVVVHSKILKRIEKRALDDEKTFPRL